MSAIVHVSRAALEAMLAEARSMPGVECCGLLAGHNGVISVVLPAKNALASASAYEISAAELFKLFRRIRAEGLDHLGIYHSHPRGENTPSPLDIERAFFPEAAYFILSPLGDAPQPVRAFRMIGGQARELEIRSSLINA